MYLSTILKMIFLTHLRSFFMQQVETTIEITTGQNVEGLWVAKLQLMSLQHNSMPKALETSRKMR